MWIVENGRFRWTDAKLVWDWDGCNFSLARLAKNGLCAVVRSSASKVSHFMGGRAVDLRYMIGFNVREVTPPQAELYSAWTNPHQSKEQSGLMEMFFLKRDGDRWIWQWAEGEIEDSEVYRTYRRIIQEIERPPPCDR